MTVEDWLGKDNELGISIWNKKYRNNKESFDEWLDRVSNKDENIKRLILERKFIFGGRILANRGTNKGSFSNCYSVGYVDDSLDSIMDTATDIAMTFKAQGGQGLSLSKIRPKGALIRDAFESDGIVPFMEIFNTVTSSISQGGHRRGALMMSLDINHPEAETFMTIKSDHNKINNANLSMEIDDNFMEKVVNGNTEANRLFNILCTQACKHAEPGVLFTNKLRNYNLMEYVDSYQIETTNPCGEQPLPAGGSCNLSSINISEYIKNPFTKESYIDFDSLHEDCYHIVKAMDDVLEENLPNHALDVQKKTAEEFRNVGIGIMGLHDAFIKMGFVYGDNDSITFTKCLMVHLLFFTLKASVRLAEVRGQFKHYSREIWDSSIFKHAKACYPDIYWEDVENRPLRNCSLLSIAPTGSIGTMWNVSTGVEPWFALHYTRNTKSLDNKESSYEVWAPIAKQAKDLNWCPNTLITSNDIPWGRHIDVQAAAQEFCDTSISKTINMKKGTTPEEIKQAYIYAWRKGLKGCTVYVDGSRDPILTTEKKEEKKEEKKKENTFNTITPVSRKQMGVTHGSTFCKKCACGTLYVTVNKDNEDNIVEVFTHTSKGGICQANLNAETRMASLALRSGVKVSEVIDQLKGISCPACTTMKAKGKQVDGMSCADIIARTMEQFIKPKMEYPRTEEEAKNGFKNLEKCPECGEYGLTHQGGCNQCLSCGYTKCQ